MKKISLIAVAFAACCGTAFAGPFDQFKGKMKPGLYEYNMSMEMPGMPPGMGKHTMKHCVTESDISGGDWAKSKDAGDCDIQDVKMSGNTATYRMVCKGQNPMTADTKLTFRSDGFTSDTKMTMNQGGQAMNMTQHMDGKYLGACK